ncbi:glycosyltransferase family A protein [Marinobacter sp.]|uniref:glycosyltransferase family A protein n=1 Tax=Marinobacter sp. TaxID=50741 RepID=UPI0034A2C67E
MNERLLFCVFSFNRGRFLEHCVSTIEECVPNAEIAIFDDDSFDEYTLDALKTLSERHTVLQPGNQSTHKLGGLYGNMQSALEFAADQRLVCFLQDDMQVVRPLDKQEIDAFDRCFEDNPRLAFLHPCFLKGINRERDGSTLSFDGELSAYRRTGTGQSAGQYFSAILITRPSRLLEQSWEFGRSEPVNDRQAKQYFDRIGHLFSPFAMWLPEVPTYRGKRKTLALRLAEKRRGCGFFPYKLFDEQEAKSFRERSPEVLPIAEDFLVCTNRRLEKPWGYYPMQGSRWLKKLNSLELALRRIF